mmetsp:Transcript_37894/g.83072  ORF Transcript_37894/g.83072 Transcript_37894/m.83072 type:complete len:226 (+) Transcript_37894:554-1231(+)
MLLQHTEAVNQRRHSARPSSNEQPSHRRRMVVGRREEQYTHTRHYQPVPPEQYPKSIPYPYKRYSRLEQLHLQNYIRHRSCSVCTVCGIEMTSLGPVSWFSMMHRQVANVAPDDNLTSLTRPRADSEPPFAETFFLADQRREGIHLLCNRPIGEFLAVHRASLQQSSWGRSYCLSFPMCSLQSSTASIVVGILSNPDYKIGYLRYHKEEWLSHPRQALGCRPISV